MIEDEHKVIVRNMSTTDGGKICEQEPIEEEMQDSGTKMLQQLALV